MHFEISSTEGLESVAVRARDTAYRAYRDRMRLGLGLTMPNFCRVHIGYYPNQDAVAVTKGDLIVYGILPAGTTQPMDAKTKSYLELVTSYINLLRVFVPNNSDKFLIDLASRDVESLQGSLKPMGKGYRPDLGKFISMIQEGFGSDQDLIKKLVPGAIESVRNYFSVKDLPHFSHELDHVDVNTYRFMIEHNLRKVRFGKEIRRVASPENLEDLRTSLSDAIKEDIAHHVYFESRAFLLEEILKGRDKNHSDLSVRERIKDYGKSSFLRQAIKTYFGFDAEFRLIDPETSRKLSLVGHRNGIDLQEIDHPRVKKGRIEFFDDFESITQSAIERIQPIVLDALWENPSSFTFARDAVTLAKHLDLIVGAKV